MWFNSSPRYAPSTVTDTVELQIFHRGCVQNFVDFDELWLIYKDVVTVKQKALHSHYKVSRENVLML